MQLQEMCQILEPYIENKEYFAKMQETLLKKGNDYASQGIFWNFETSATYALVQPSDVFEVMIGIKISRLFNLKLFAKTINYEGVEDTILDLSNYMLLYIMYLITLTDEYDYYLNTIHKDMIKDINDLTNDRVDEFMKRYEYLVK